MARQNAGVARQRKGAAEPQVSTRDRLLDAAEELFAAHGYDGASLRDIAGVAKVPFGLATYYFGTKEEMFRQVVARRADEHVSSIMQSLEAAVATALPGPASIEALIVAYFGPMVDKLADRGPGWRNYMQLLARAANIKQEQEFLTLFQQLYDPVRLRMVDIAATIFPAAAREDVLWASHFLNAAIIQFIAGEGSIDRLSGGLCRAGDLDSIVRRMVPYFAGGFRALLDRPVA